MSQASKGVKKAKKAKEADLRKKVLKKSVKEGIKTSSQKTTKVQLLKLLKVVYFKFKC